MKKLMRRLDPGMPSGEVAMKKLMRRLDPGIPSGEVAMKKLMRRLDPGMPTGEVDNVAMDRVDCWPDMASGGRRAGRGVRSLNRGDVLEELIDTVVGVQSGIGCLAICCTQHLLYGGKFCDDPITRSHAAN
jgi:hypothetical protein